MMARPLPKSWLIHDIVYEEHTGRKDSYGDPLFGDPITIKRVRFDDSIVFSRDSTDTKVLANAIVFVDSTNSTNLPESFVEQSKITFNEHEYVLKR